MSDNKLTQQHFEYASYTRRFFASVIDGLILVFISLLFNICIWNVDVKIPVFGGKIFWLIDIFLVLFYYSLFTSSNLKASLGQSLCGIYSLDTNFEKLSFYKALFRTVIAFTICCIISIIFIARSLICEYGLRKFGIRFSFYGIQTYLLLGLFFCFLMFHFIVEDRTIYDRLTKTKVMIKIKEGD